MRDHLTDQIRRWATKAVDEPLIEGTSKETALHSGSGISKLA
jgi:hypothetical protein